MDERETLAVENALIRRMVFDGGWISGVQVDRLHAEIAELQRQLRWRQERPERALRAIRQA